MFCFFNNNYHTESLTFKPPITTTTEPSTLEFYITVYCSTECSYTLRGFADNSVGALVEGVSIAMDVNKMKYRYFSFHDNDLSEEVLISLHSDFGDSDLYVGCDLLPSGISLIMIKKSEMKF